MMMRITWLTLALSLWLAAPAFAQVTFERKLAESTTNRTEVVSRTTQKLTIAGMEIDTESESRTTVQSTTGKRDGSGNLKRQSKVEELQISIKTQGTEYVFDSANPDKSGGSALEIVRPIHKGTLQRVTTTTFNNENRVVNIEFDQDPLNGLNDQVRKLYQSNFDLDKMKDTANQELDRLPADPVKVGDVWDRTSVLNLEGGQLMTLTTKYKYLGEKDVNGKKLDQIESEVQSVTFSLAADSALPFTLKSSDLKSKDSKGVLEYDRRVGQVVSSKSTLQITGDITFVINNQELPAVLDLKIESSSKPKE